MGDATGRLGEGNADGAVDSQGRALEALRKGAQSLAEAMQQGDGDQPGDGPGTPRRPAAGRGQRNQSLGRPMRHNRFLGDFSVKIPTAEIDVQRVRRILLRRRLCRSGSPADRARLHRAAAEKLLSSPSAQTVIIAHAGRPVFQRRLRLGESRGVLGPPLSRG